MEENNLDKNDRRDGHQASEKPCDSMNMLEVRQAISDLDNRLAELEHALHLNGK